MTNIKIKGLINMTGDGTIHNVRVNGELLPDVVIANGRSVISPDNYPDYYEFDIAANFTFVGSGLDVIQLLETSHKNITKYIEGLYALLT